MNNLQHLHVLVTRPDPGGEALCRQITRAGGEAIHFPTLAFAAPSDLSAFEQGLAMIGDQQWLLFISPQAVYASISSIRSHWPQLPPGLQIAAVGAGTAKALKEAGYLVSVYPEGQFSSEGLLDLADFQSIMDKKIMIVRGEGGRDVLDCVLAARGAMVSHLIAYQRILPRTDVAPLLALLQQRGVNVVVCTSYEGVRNLKILLGERGWSLIKNIPMIVMSGRIKMLALDLDFQTIWVAQKASSDAIIDMLAQRKDELCQTKAMKS